MINNLDLGIIRILNNVAPPHINKQGIATSTYGFQQSHLYGQSLWAQELSGLINLIGPNGILDNGDPYNGIHKPESATGGQNLGVAVHRGTHYKDWDRLSYDFDEANDSSDRFINTLHRKLEMELSNLEKKLDLAKNEPREVKDKIKNDISDKKLEARIAFAAYADYKH
ncbi:MAG: hypothetical protein AAFW46_14565, partial [Pseudomonadota bacterium]